jgi:P27 family predicted phage terminase small subunit
MARTGRPPKPTRLKLLYGNPGKRPLNHNEPQPRDEMPDPPPHLTGEAREEWFRICRELNRIGLLTQVDRAAFAGYCVAWSQWITALAELDREGQTLVDDNGRSYSHPAVNHVIKFQTTMHRFLSEFGLTPSSRSRLIIGDPNETASGLQAFLGRDDEEPAEPENDTRDGTA